METDNFGYDDVDDGEDKKEDFTIDLTDSHIIDKQENEFDETGTLDVQNPIYQAALYYLKLKLPILPICPCDHRGMSLTHRTRCKSPGKTPLLADWSKRDTPTLDELQHWYNGSKSLNVGLVLGETTNWNIVGIDIDGVLGEKLLQEWSFGVVPITWEFTTGEGRRLLYKLPPGMKSKKFRKGENKVGELALLASGQQTILPPSKHVSGKFYTWVEGHSPSDLALAAAPEWLVSRVALDVDENGNVINESPRVTNEDWAQKLTTGQRNVQVARLAGSLLSKRHMNKEDTLLFLYNWNERHCDPPLDKNEIDAMVNSIFASEEMKLSKRNVLNGGKAKKKQVTIVPTVVAENFLNIQQSSGVEWKYIAKEDSFYYCDREIGPWLRCPNTELDRRVREQLMVEDDSWGMRRYITEVEGALKEALFNQDEEDLFDIGKHPDLEHIYCSNGTLNWQTGELEAWDWKSYSPIRLPVKWNLESLQSVGYQMWLKNLEDWIPEQQTRDFLQEFIGYSLLPDCSYRTSVFLYGSGVNGKSLFLEVVKLLFGDWLESLPLQRINEKFDTVSLQNRLINICSDIDPKYMTDTGNLKLIIAGEDIRGERKYGMSYTFTPVCRLVFSANTLPKSIDKSEGWFSRWKIVTFPNRFAVNSTYKKLLMDTMKKPESLSALLFWAVEGLKRLKENGKFTVSAGMQQDSISYRNENDSVAGFFNHFIEKADHKGSDTILTTSSLYATYREYCTETGAKAVGQIEFTKRIQNFGVEKGCRPIKKKSVTCFLGVQFRQEAIEDFNARESYSLTEALRLSAVR